MNTLLIKRKDTGDNQLIKAHRFNPEIHTIVEEKSIKKVVKKEESAYNDISTMKFFELKKYAKEKGVAFDSKTTKDTILARLAEISN